MINFRMLHKFKVSFNSAVQIFLAKKIINLLLLLISAILFYFLSFEIGFFFLILSFSMVNRFSPKVLIIGALVLLVSIPLFLILEQDSTAEKIAIYVYYLLIATVIVEVTTLIKNRLKTKNNLNQSVKVSSDEELERTVVEIEAKPTLQLTQKKSISMEFQRRPTIINSNIILAIPPEKPIAKKLTEIIESKKPNKNINLKKLFTNLSGPIDNSEPKQKFTFPNFGIKVQNIPSFWNYIVLSISALIPIVIFRFTGLPSFRDLTTVPYFYNIQNGPFDLSVIENIAFNQLTRFLNPETISSLFFQLFFFLGTIVSYFFLLKIQKIFTTNDSYTSSNSNKILVFLISLLYVYNPFTFERFLMGQHFVLRGHLLFIPVIFYLLQFLIAFTEFKKPEFYLLSEKNISSFSNFGWALTLISLLSTHHGLFAISLAIIGFIFIGLSNIKYIYKNVKKTDSSAILNNIFKVFSILLLIVLPSVIIFINRYSNNPQQVTFEKQKIEQPDLQRQTISAFSLKVLDDQNLVSKALIGAASWNTPSFSEVNSIAVSLGSLRKASIYYSPKLNIFFILFICIILGYCAYLADKFFKPLLFPFLLLIPILLILNFGYSGNFEKINSLFFSLPFSYTFREAGKFYSLFLALLSVILVTYNEHFTRYIRKISIGIFSFILIGNLLVFLPLSQNIVYADYPEILKDLSANCKRSDKTKVLFLPFTTYIYPSYSNVFTANYSRYLLNCEVLSADYTILENRELTSKSTNKIELSNSKVSNSINGIISTFTKSNSTDSNAYENLRKELRIFGVYTIVVDETNYSDTSNYDLGVFSKKLQQYITPDSTQKNDIVNMSIYSLK